MRYKKKMEKTDERFEQDHTGHPRMFRMLKLLNALSSGVYYTAPEMGRMIGASRSTVMRYLSSFRQAGFNVECMEGGRYRLTRLDESLREFSQLVHFSEEEAYLINMALDAVSPTNTMKANLKNKLLAVYSTVSLQKYTIIPSHAENIDRLTAAMHNREQAVLMSYCSSHGGDVRDRLVEPFAFTADCRSVVCYDLGDGAVKHFCTARMKAVAMTGVPWLHEDEHRIPETDIFEMSGRRIYPVRVRLSARGRNLLEEEWPKSIPFIRREGVQWVFEATLCSLEGMARFAMGLPGDVIPEGECSGLRGLMRTRALRLADELGKSDGKEENPFRQSQYVETGGL